MPVYVYAIAKDSHPLDLDGVKGVGESPAEVRAVRSGSLCAVVSDAPEEISVRRRDLQAHNEVQGRLWARGTILPLGFGYVAENEDAVRAVLESRADEFSQRLDELTGRAEFKAAGDDYSAILSSALADRLAEAFAEALHYRVRTELWGYAPDEAFDIDALVGEKYRGIRPAPGYPAQPDHTEKDTLFRILEAPERTGMQITESFAMTPPASVSGLYFSHPEAHYFGVGKIDRDQVEDYASRKGWTLATAERWLAPILSYDPARERNAAA